MVWDTHRALRSDGTTQQPASWFPPLSSGKYKRFIRTLAHPRRSGFREGGASLALAPCVTSLKYQNSTCPLNGAWLDRLPPDLESRFPCLLCDGESATCVDVALVPRSYESYAPWFNQTPRRFLAPEVPSVPPNDSFDSRGKGKRGKFGSCRLARVHFPASCRNPRAWASTTSTASV